MAADAKLIEVNSLDVVQNKIETDKLLFHFFLIPKLNEVLLFHYIKKRTVI